MVNAGELAELCNSDDVTLTNQTNALTFGQLFNITWNSATPTQEKAHVDGSRDTTDQVDNLSIEGDIFITIPEITTLVSYRAKTGNALPTKNWDIGFVGDNAVSDTIRIVAKLTQLQFIAPEKGYSLFHIKLESEDGAITEP